MNTRTYKTALAFNDRMESITLTEREHKYLVDRILMALLDDLSPYSSDHEVAEWILHLIRDHIGASAFDRGAAELAEEGGEG